MLVAGLVSHQIEVKNDWNHPHSFGVISITWHIAQILYLYFIKFSQYNQQGSLTT